MIHFSIQPLHKAFLIFLFSNLLIVNVLAQSSVVSGLNNDKYYRYELAAYQTPNFHTAIKPYILEEIKNYGKIDSSLNLKKLLFYSDNDTYVNNNFFTQKQDSLKLIINPIYTSVSTLSNSTQENAFNLQLGVSLNVKFGKMFAAHADLFYSKVLYANYIVNQIDSSRIIPHFGRKIASRGNRFEFTNGTRYFSYTPTNYFNVQLGVEKHFFGDGYRSLLLSDNANSFPFVKTTFSLMNFKYVSLFTAFKDVNTKDLTFDLHQKYASMHFLSLNVTKNFNLNFFEAIVFNPIDSIGGNRGFDVNYLNPVIFFRPVEFSLGSPDNVLLGVGFKVNFAKRYNVYGQVILDEFIVSKMLKQGVGYWENKQGAQLGFKIFDFAGLKGLYLQGEANVVRPFAYSHQNSIQSYGNYHQPLADPLGANFKEAIAIIRYNRERFTVSFKVVYSIKGENSDTLNYGGNIYWSYLNRTSESGQRDVGHVTTQGLKTTLNYAEVKLAYVLNPKFNFQFEVGIISRKLKSVNQVFDNFIYFGFRTNIFNENFDY